MKCAPGRELICGSCFRKDELICMCKVLKSLFGSINEEEVDLSTLSRCRLWTHVRRYLDKFLNDHTDNDWLLDEQLLSRIRLFCPNLFNTFRYFSIRPKFSGNVTSGWLNNVDIEMVMAQYQNIYPDLFFAGAHSADLSYLHCEQRKLCPTLIETADATCMNFAIILNTGTLQTGGEHWVCCYKDKDSNILEFFDSQPDKTSSELQVTLDWLCADRYVLKKNTLRHQYDDHMCGCFAMFFILCRTIGITFEQLDKHAITFEDIKEFRNLLFS